jgi:hypothetical protein
MSKIRIIVAGGRDFSDYQLMRTEFLAFVGKNQNTDVLIISGAAKGADQMGEQLANEFNIQLMQMPAEWDKHGRSAGYIRNAEMADEATHVLAMWDGESRGTKHMIDIATKKGLTLKVVNYVAPPRKRWSDRIVTGIGKGISEC